MAFSRDWDETTPTDDTTGYDLDNHIRNLRVDTRERAGEQHVTYDDDDGETDVWEHKPGESTVLFVGNKADFPTPATTTEGCIAIAEDEDNKPYFWNGTAWTTCALALLGAANTFAEIQVFTKGLFANNAYIEVRNAAGDGNVDLIKADASDVPVVPDGTQTATDAAPDEDKDLVNKKYPDDLVNSRIGAGSFSPTAYAGEESITFPNGLILKHGYIADAGATTSVTFGAAFPTAATSVQITHKSGSAIALTATVTVLNTTTLTFVDSSVTTGYYWQVWGY